MMTAVRIKHANGRSRHYRVGPGGVIETAVSSRTGVVGEWRVAEDIPVEHVLQVAGLLLPDQFALPELPRPSDDEIANAPSHPYPLTVPIDATRDDA